jgi:hypothetical protein
VTVDDFEDFVRDTLVRVETKLDEHLVTHRVVHDIAGAALKIVGLLVAVMGVGVATWRAFH